MDAKYAELIAGFSLFQGFTAQGAGRIIDRGEVKSYASGDIPFREGEAPEFVLLVLQRTMEVFVERHGDALVLTEVGPGAILGELAVLCGIQRSASVRARAAVVALQWTAVAFRNMLLRYPLLSERVFRESLRTLVEKEQALIESLAPARKNPQPVD